MNSFEVLSRRWESQLLLTLEIGQICQNRVSFTEETLYLKNVPSTLTVFSTDTFAESFLIAENK